MVHGGSIAAHTKITVGKLPFASALVSGGSGPGMSLKQEGRGADFCCSATQRYGFLTEQTFSHRKYGCSKMKEKCQRRNC